MLYPLSYEGVRPRRLAAAGICGALCTAAVPNVPQRPGGRAIPTGGIGAARRHNGTTMADLLALLADRLAPGFAAVARAGGLDEAAVAAVDPVVRVVRAADAQANGALALARRSGASRATSPTTCSPPPTSPASPPVEVAGPGFLNLTVTTPSWPALAEIAADERLGIAARGRVAARRRRLLGAQRRQGDAHRPPALDRDR